MRTCPAVIKIATLMCGFVVDDLGYGLAAHLPNITFCEKHNSNEIKGMRQSVITLNQ